MKARLLPLSLLVLSACDSLSAPDWGARSSGISAQSMRAHIAELASNRFEGRGPATKGEDLTVEYLTAQFRALGLAPGNPDGSFVQEVPMVGISSKPEIAFVKGDKRFELACPADCVAFSRRFAPEVEVKADEVLFVGYGVEAPEYAWDDYKGADTHNRVLIMLVNDPPVADPADPTRLDEHSFNGKAMTYYGRWTYKYEIGRKKDAAAVLIVHEEGPAGYPFSVVQSSWGRENFDLVDKADPSNAQRRVPVEGWITLEKTKELFTAGGLDFDALKKQAATREFKPVALKELKAELKLHNEKREVRSRNVLARLEGSDPTRRAEQIVYSAHWDHLGIDPALPGEDKIYNGAVDNASGVAGLLEIAAAFADPRAPRPPRSILFLATTGEEKGLLGARWYAEHPLYPLEKTLCDINLDSLNVLGRTRDLLSIGMGQTTMDATLEELAHDHGRVVRGDSEPEKGYYYRSDHFEFARAGVPALYADSGEELVGKSAAESKRLREEYTRTRYHKPSDELRDDWDLAGAVEDVELLCELGRTLAMQRDWPAWKPGSEFKKRREDSLRAAAATK